MSCDHDCNQGRDCTCMSPQREKQVVRWCALLVTVAFWSVAWLVWQAAK